MTCCKEGQSKRGRLTVQSRPRRRPCSECKETLLLAPSSVKMIDSGQCFPICQKCFDKGSNAALVATMSAEQVADARRYFGNNVERN